MKKLLLCMTLLAFLPLLSLASPIIRSGENISIDSTQTLAGDFYGFAPTMTISGAATDDAYLLGGTVTLNAPVSGDLTIVGGAVQIHGDVGDDLRIAGGDITLANAVKGDVVITGGVVTVLSTASIEGDLIFMGGELLVEGEVKGSVHGTANKVRLNSKIGGNVSLTAESLVTLGDNAHVVGNVTYKSRNDLVRAQEAQVTGNIQKTTLAPEAKGNPIQNYLVVASVIVFAAMLLYFVGRRHLTRMIETNKNIGFSGLIGLSALLLTPFIAILLMLSVIGSIIGVFLLAVYVALLTLSLMIAGGILGFYVQRALTKKNSFTPSTVFWGTLLFTSIGLVPYIGGFLVLAGVVITLGMITTALYRGFHS